MTNTLTSHSLGVITRIKENYGDAGLCALETSCVTDEDYRQGYEHVIDMILPALEEELLRGDG